MSITLGTITPLRAQVEYLGSGAGDLLHGGSAGGGKTWVGFDDLVKRGAKWPGIRVLVMRRHFSGELEQKWLPWARNLPEELGVWYEGRTTFSYRNGCKHGCVHYDKVRSHPESVITFDHGEHETDVHKQQGEDVSVLVLDEATLFTPYQLAFLIHRCVRGPEYLPRRVRLLSNPGGPGHEWVKERYIDPETNWGDEHYHGEGQWEYPCYYSHAIWQPYEDGKPTRTRQFIPSSWRENIYIDRAEYEAELSGLPEPLRSAHRDGRWDITTETAFAEFGRAHLCPAIPLESQWSLGIGVDAGFYPDPWCVIFAAHDFSVKDTIDPSLHRVYVWGEVYQKSVVTQQQVDLIRMIVLQSGGRQMGIQVIGGHDMEARRGYHAGQTESMAVIYRRILGRAGMSFRVYPGGPNSRAQRKYRLHQFLSQAPDGRPFLQIMEGRAPNLVRSLPRLVTDPRDPDDVQKRGLEDHPYDALSYLLASKVWATERPLAPQIQFTL